MLASETARTENGGKDPRSGREAADLLSGEAVCM